MQLFTKLRAWQQLRLDRELLDACNYNDKERAATMLLRGASTTALNGRSLLAALDCREPWVVGSLAEIVSTARFGQCVLPQMIVLHFLDHTHEEIIEQLAQQFPPVQQAKANTLKELSRSLLPNREAKAVRDRHARVDTLERELMAAHNKLQHGDSFSLSAFIETTLLYRELWEKLYPLNPERACIALGKSSDKLFDMTSVTEIYDLCASFFGTQVMEMLNKYNAVSTFLKTPADAHRLATWCILATAIEKIWKNRPLFESLEFTLNAVRSGGADTPSLVCAEQCVNAIHATFFDPTWSALYPYDRYYPTTVREALAYYAQKPILHPAFNFTAVQEEPVPSVLPDSMDL